MAHMYQNWYVSAIGFWSGRVLNGVKTPALIHLRPRGVALMVLGSIAISFISLVHCVRCSSLIALGEIRTLLFALAFVCIGLETCFVELTTYEQGRPALAFIGAQTFNVFWTLLLAWLLFGGVLVAEPVIN